MFGFTRQYYGGAIAGVGGGALAMQYACSIGLFATSYGPVIRVVCFILLGMGLCVARCGIRTEREKT